MTGQQPIRYPGVGFAKARPIKRPGTRFLEAWQFDVPVETLRPGDVFRHRTIAYRRRIVSIKPHPRGGVQVKTVPEWAGLSRCENPAGKILKFHLAGVADRWDGSTMIEAAG